MTLVPSGVWVRALSSRIRMICRTLSGSASAVTGRPGVRSSKRESRSSARAPNSRVTSRASELRSTRSGSSRWPPASSWERLSRSAVSLVRRSICRRIVRTNSARSSGLGSSSSSSSTNPPRLKIGVRSSCEALAMNCLRALCCFVVVWREPHAGNSEIRASIIGNDGLTDVASDFLVNTTTASNQDPDVVALADGGFLVTWKDITHLAAHGQRFDAHGDKIGAEFTLPGGAATGHFHGAPLTDDHIAFAFDAFISSGFDVTTSIFTVDTPLDFNANGLSDILWQNDNGAPALWLMNGLTVQSNSPAGPFNPGPSWHVKDSGDFNADGHADILWQNDDGMPAIWLMNGSNALSNGAAGSFNPGPDWQIKVTGDFNGDGKSDILWQGSDGTPAIWLMNGLTVLSHSPAGSFNPGHVAHHGHRRLQRRQQVRHPVAERRWHARDLADGRHRPCCPTAPPVRSIQGPRGTSRPPATSTATASPTSCGRTTTAHPRSG